EGWEVSEGRREDWTVEKGALVSRSGPKAGLRTARRYRDFILRLEWRIPTEGHARMALLRPGTGNSAWVDLYGDPPNVNFSGVLRGWINGKAEAAYANAGTWRGPGQWNECEITWRGGRFTVKANREVVVDTDVKRSPWLAHLPEAGPIGL